MARLACVAALEPLDAAAVGREPEFEGLVRAARASSSSPMRAARTGALDHHAHFGVQVGRARIEVERADEDACAIDGEGLGVQAASPLLPGPLFGSRSFLAGASDERFNS